MKSIEHPSKTYMNAAIEVAKKGAKDGQYALGAIVVSGSKVTAATNTTLHRTYDPSAHAEMNAIRMATKKAKSRYLPDAWLYTTLEPCPMCTSMAIWAKMSGIVYGSSKEDAMQVYLKNKNLKFSWRQIDISAEYVAKKGTPKLKIIKKFMRTECLKLFYLKK
jgi:tRNA(adenine34) deaminase